MTTDKQEFPELLPCPFCGETGDKVVCDSLGDSDWFVECDACRMALHAYHPTKESAVKHWNTRAKAEDNKGKAYELMEHAISNAKAMDEPITFDMDEAEFLLSALSTLTRPQEIDVEQIRWDTVKAVSDARHNPLSVDAGSAISEAIDHLHSSGRLK